MIPKLTASTTEKGAPLKDMPEQDMSAEAQHQIAEVRLAMDRSGKFNATGHLRASLTMVRTPDGSELHPPSDRLGTPTLRENFLELLRVWMGQVR